jgi:Protein of unknown function (DUF1501)
MKRHTSQTRRDFLKSTLPAAALGAAFSHPLAQVAQARGASLLAPLPTHHQPKAKNLIILFLTGGFSHVDTFDYKPMLAKYHGKPVPAFGLRPDERHEQPLLASPFRFHRQGQSGLPISDLFPALGAMADDLCVINSLHSGSATIPLPSIGSWISFGLGTVNANLPAYVVLCERLPYAGSQVWDSNFLPPIHQGVRIIPGPDPIPDLQPPDCPVTLRVLEQAMLHDMNQDHASRRPGDQDLLARISTFDIARGMMHEAPEVLNVSSEPPRTLAAFGVSDGDTTSFAYQCLIARRLIERGVRVVEVIDTGSNNNWDAHGNMQEHRPKAQRVDQAIAALLSDLKQRGLLDETLVAICTEFGRTPWTDNPTSKGRNHYAKAFTALLAGAGVKGGMAHGQTDEFGINIVANPVHVHDYHATILHLMGLDHTRLTYRYAGRDFRLTDVDGNVIQAILS